jgi:hypothetical protein
MKKVIMLMAVTLACSTAAQAQLYVQPVNYSAYPQSTYTVSQPLYGTPVYNPAPAYTPVSTYYVGNPCGQRVACNYACSPCCNPCCNPCGVTYASAAPCAPCAPQAVYAPVTYAPAPVACGPQACIRRGLLGQPVVYVPGQPVRNALRFLTP